MDNTWQVLQWFDIEMVQTKKLLEKCKQLKDDGNIFTNDVVNSLLFDCPIDNNVDVRQLVEQFNGMLHSL